MSDKYILNDEGEPIPEPDLMAWATWYETANRHVAVDQVGDSKISTVFLGLDHNYGGRSEPILWETMVFGGSLNGEQDRCSGNRSDAFKMHKRMLEKVKTLKPA